MGLVELAAAKTLASSAVFLFITVLMIAAAKRTATCIALFAAQCAIITAQIVAMGFVRHSGEAFVVAAMVLLVKVIAIPYALVRITRRLKVSPTVSASTTPGLSIFIAAVLILLAFVVVQPYARAFALDSEMLAAATAIVLTGGFLMVSRRKALMQVIGLLVLENGIFLAALTTTFGMPLVIEMGIFFDLLMCVLLLGVFVFRIRETFEHVDVSRLRRLRG
jgi:hydrogenase-4 component E